MHVETFLIAGPALLRPKKFEDARGFFSEVYSETQFNGLVGEFRFVQDNFSLSKDKGIVRGLHFQTTPYEQGKLVRATRGSIFDVAVDLRRSSSTYGKFISVILSAENWSQLWVPPGFAHGFCTLEPNSEVTYKVTARYSHEHDFGLAWNDPELGIPWPVSERQAILSEKDRIHPRLSELSAYFP